MSNITELNEKINALYEEYKNKSKLNITKSKEAARLLADITEGTKSAEVAIQLSKFPADVTKYYFEAILKSGNINVKSLDEILKEFMAADNNAAKSQFFVPKFVAAVCAIVSNSKDKAQQSEYLPRVVVTVSRFALKSEKFGAKFKSMIDDTAGEIYTLDYSKMDKALLSDIWSATNAAYPDLSKVNYKEPITEWAKMYGFTAPSLSEDNTAVSGMSEYATKEYVEALFKSLYTNLKNDLDKEKTEILYALEKYGASLNSRELSDENMRLKLQNTELQKRTDELNARIKEANESLSEIKAQRDELEEKLKDAYSINSRESSLEAQKLRADLTKALSFSYEDWREYEDSEVSEDNYESLQAIIQKIFRALERNGIDFKGNSK